MWALAVVHSRASQRISLGQIGVLSHESVAGMQYITCSTHVSYDHGALSYGDALLGISLRLYIPSIYFINKKLLSSLKKIKIKFSSLGNLVTISLRNCLYLQNEI